MATFLYFAYGSNLLKQRLQLQNPSATFVTTAVLKNYRLAFSTFGRDPSESRWKGAGATIQEAQGQNVWGCIWRLHNEHMETLDRQESFYCPIDVTVTGSDEKEYSCRTYQVETTENMADSLDNRPSKYYMEVIIKGAKQNGICTDYVQFLENVEPNGITTAPDVYLQTMKLLGEGNSGSL